MAPAWWEAWKDWYRRLHETPPDPRVTERKRKALYNHRRDMLLEALRLRRWLDGHDYEEDPPE